MNRMQKLTWVTILLGVLFLAGCGWHHRNHQRCNAPCAMQQEAAPAAKSEPGEVRYLCNCGPQCKCVASSAMPGNCPCGQPMKQAE